MTGAPWSVIEATNARYRDVAVGRTILNALTARLAESPPEGLAVSEQLFSPGDRQATVLDTVDLTRKTSDKKAYDKELNRLQRELHAAVHAGAGPGTVDGAGLRGLGRCRQGRGDPADHAGAGGRRLPGDLHRRPDRGGAQVPLPLAVLAGPAARREVVIYDRTWYGRVLVERIEGFATPAEWQRAYDEINDFEDQMVEHGYFVAKFWLHISPEEQLARFQARENTPEKAHKITEEDYRNRERWDGVRPAPSTRWCCARPRATRRGTSSRPTTSSPPGSRCSSMCAVD